jgi:hypothetical protein
MGIMISSIFLFVTLEVGPRWLSNARDREAGAWLDCYCVEYNSFSDSNYTNCSVSWRSSFSDTLLLANPLSKVPVHTLLGHFAR